MLRWSAEKTNRPIDFGAIVDVSTPLGINGGAELVSLGAAAAGTEADASHTHRLAEVVGDAAAVKAAAVAGAFELYNRIVDATGLPVGRVQRDSLSDVIDTLGLDGFPHAGHGV